MPKNKPMTSAERSRKFRERRKAQGGRAYMLNLTPEQVQFIHKLAELPKKRKQENFLLRAVIMKAIAELQIIDGEITQAKCEGATDIQITAYFKSALHTAPETFKKWIEKNK